MLKEVGIEVWKVSQQVHLLRRLSSLVAGLGVRVLGLGMLQAQHGVHLQVVRVHLHHLPHEEGAQHPEPPPGPLLRPPPVGDHGDLHVLQVQADQLGHLLLAILQIIAFAVFQLGQGIAQIAVD